tara:strand:+ start:1759 stop:1989 length:231 start_codon:yes stop_codon:yes gene_type:complete
MKYIIETYTICDGWIPAEHETDSDGVRSLVTYDTMAEGKAELVKFLGYITESDIQGAYSADNWRVAPLTMHTPDNY